MISYIINIFLFHIFPQDQHNRSSLHLIINAEFLYQVMVRRWYYLMEQRLRTTQQRCGL